MLYPRLRFQRHRRVSPMVLTVVGGAFGLLVGIAGIIYDRSMRT